jgi:hypothetical protein
MLEACLDVVTTSVCLHACYLRILLMLGYLFYMPASIWVAFGLAVFALS